MAKRQHAPTVSIHQIVQRARIFIWNYPAILDFCCRHKMLSFSSPSRLPEVRPWQIK